MKILMLGWELPPHNSGGLGVACYQLCKALSSQEVAIEFVLPYTEAHDAPFMTVTAAHPQGAKVVLTTSSAYDSYKYVYDDGHEEWVDIYQQQQAFEQAVSRVVVEKDYDIVHAHDWLTFRAALRAKQARDCPLILHVHSVERDRAGGADGNPLVVEIEATSMVLADKILAVSQLTKDAIIRDYHIPASKIDVVHNSIDHDSFVAPTTDTLYPYLAAMKQQGYHIVANVGRLTVQKGLMHFLEAAQLVVERVPKTLFLIVGSGEQYYELIVRAAERGIAQNVLFSGFQRGQAWRDAFRVADLFVMPSVSEPFGLTPLESIGFGTPALITKQSGVSEVLLNCLKVDYWDTVAMADKITAVVQNDSLRDELQHNARRELDGLSWNKTAEQLVAIYQNQLEAVV